MLPVGGGAVLDSGQDTAAATAAVVLPLVARFLAGRFGRMWLDVVAVAAEPRAGVFPPFLDGAARWRSQLLVEMAKKEKSMDSTPNVDRGLRPINATRGKPS